MKKNFKLALALILSIMMVLASVPAMAEDDGATTATNPGSITISSPIMGATYTGYQVFDLKLDNVNNPTAFGYSIANTSPFYKTVAEYAAVAENGLTLTPVPATKLAAADVNGAEYGEYSITASNAFDAQAFGQVLEAAIKDSTITGATVYHPTKGTKNGAETAMAETDVVTVQTSSSVIFDNLPLGYYLILSAYPPVTAKITIGEGDNAKEVNLADVDDATINAAIQAYVNETVTDEYVEEHYNGEKAWADLSDEEKAQAKQDTKDSMTADAKAKVEKAIEESKDNPALSDLNVQTQRLVFIDSTTPDANIVEKNEIDKWDVPVNPEGSSELPTIPEHEEPKGGKNIIIREGVWNTEENKWDTEPIYANATEADIGKEVHYQLSINAVNFKRDENNKPQQIKEYIVADFENKNMEFVESKGLMVTIVKKDKDGNIVEMGTPVDYVAWKDKFFHNDNKTDLGANEDILGADKDGGLVIPWVEKLNEKPDDMTNVTETVYFKTDANGERIFIPEKAEEGTTAENVVERYGEGYTVDEEGNLFKDGTALGHYDTGVIYCKSLYPDDVTILVDYYMTLTDTAIIAGDGNINVSQYGVTYVDSEDYNWTPTTPGTPEDRKPDETKEKDDATVYTYAIAIKKVDENDQPLAGAEFQIKGLTAVTTKSDGFYKAKTYDRNAADYTGAVTLKTDKNGVLVVDGFQTKWDIEVKEIKAPEGYNILTEPQTIKPVKTTAVLSSTSKVTYKDEEGNVTEISTSVIEYKKGETAVAKMEKVGNQVKYYQYTGGKYVELADDEGEGGKTAEAKFNELIAKFTEPEETEVTAATGITELKVVNNKGTELPATGGIGTTIFYVAGSILVLAAAILLITKRRMGAND